MLTVGGARRPRGDGGSVVSAREGHSQLASGRRRAWCIRWAAAAAKPAAATAPTADPPPSQTTGAMKPAVRCAHVFQRVPHVRDVLLLAAVILGCQQAAL